MALVEPKNTIEVLKKYGFSFRKRYGQNFLIDSHVLSKIISAAELTKEDHVLEIGPGIGTLTEALSEAARDVTAVEIDETLIPILADTLSACKNVTVVQGDVMKFDVDAFVREKCGGKRVKVVANLPYYITTPIIMELLSKGAPIDSVTVMVQKEVADRMSASPGTKEYGALSLAVQYYAEPYLAANVPKNCFMPRPDVDSAVVRLTRRETPPCRVSDENLFFAVIRASFNARRKTLVNGLRNAEFPEFTKEEIEESVAAAGCGPNVRGETLSIDEFAAVSNRLFEIRSAK